LGLVKYRDVVVFIHVSEREIVLNIIHRKTSALCTQSLIYVPMYTVGGVIIYLYIYYIILLCRGQAYPSLSGLRRLDNLLRLPRGHEIHDINCNIVITCLLFFFLVRSESIVDVPFYVLCDITFYYFNLFPFILFLFFS